MVVVGGLLEDHIGPAAVALALEDELEWLVVIGPLRMSFRK